MNLKLSNIRSLVTVLLIFFATLNNLEGQKRQDRKSAEISYTLSVRDATGKPLPGVFANAEGVSFGLTDSNGHLTFMSTPDTYILLSLEGYETSVVLAETLSESNPVLLSKAVLFSTSEDIIPLPYMNLKKRDITGSEVVIKGEQLEKYPGSDIRNAFTGLVNGLEVREVYGNPGVSASESQYVDKIDFLMRDRSPILLVDGMPVDLTEMPLDPDEIGTVTIIKGITGKTMFGPRGADGILLVNSKHGEMNDRSITVNVEKGISVIDRLPGFVSGADYARLNNIARFNDSLPLLYPDTVISRFALNDPYDKYYPSVNYRDLIINNVKGYQRATLSASGGNKSIRYFGYLGYTGEGDVYATGPVSDYNRINARSNLDISINDYLDMSIGIYGGLSLRRSPNYGYSFDFVEFGSVIEDINNTPPVEFPIYADNNPTLERPWYAVSSRYDENPLGNLVENGFYTEQGRSTAANITLNYDLAHILKGLKSVTNLGFNVYNQTRIGKEEDYSAYTLTRAVAPGGNDTILLTKVHEGLDTDDLIKLDDYYYQRYAFYQSFSHEISLGKTDLHNTLTYYQSKNSRQGVEEPQRLQNLVWSGVFNYNDKISVSAVLNYAGTYSFERNDRYALFPSLGVSWIITDERFLKPVQFLNYLKLRAEAGINGYDSFMTPFYYRDNYTTNTGGVAFGPFTTGQWFGTQTDNTVYRTNIGRSGNPNLTWEKRREISVGLDALLLNRKLSVDLTLYNNLRDGVVTTMTGSVPAVIGLTNTPVRENYNQYRYYGMEAGLMYKDKTGNLTYALGLNATLKSTKYLTFDEPDYRYGYQALEGNPLDSYFGYKYLGRFESDDDALVVPQLFDEVLHEGDLKYQDMNDDHVVDANDAIIIGNTDPRLCYAVNIFLGYKGFELVLTGTGRSFFDIPLTNGYFWTGWGDDNYSTYVRDNLESENYPKLTYYRVNNNFQPSEFWLTKGDFFKFQNAEISYDLQEVLKLNDLKRMKLFIRGANLLTISKVKDVDPESVSSGVSSYPLFRTFTGGIKLTF